MLSALVLAAVLPLVTGCGGSALPTYPVNGSVKFEDGTAPKFGTVEFLNNEKQINARGEIKEDGTFSVTTFNPDDGAVEGTHRIAIIQLTRSPHTARFDHQIDHNHGTVVDPKYHDFRTSGLTCEIKTGENEVKLVVAKKKNQ